MTRRSTASIFAGFASLYDDRPRRGAPAASLLVVQGFGASL